MALNVYNSLIALNLHKNEGFNRNGQNTGNVQSASVLKMKSNKVSLKPLKNENVKNRAQSSKLIKIITNEKDPTDHH